MRYKPWRPLRSAIYIFVFTFLFISQNFIAIILLLEHGLDGDMIFILIVSVVGLAPIACIVAENVFFKNITIDEKGIRYKSIFKNVFLKWEDIKIVGLAWLSFKTAYEPLLYFSTDGERYEESKLKITNDFIMFHYRKEIEATVRLYWKDTIYDLDDRDHPWWSKIKLK